MSKPNGHEVGDQIEAMVQGDDRERTYTVISVGEALLVNSSAPSDRVPAARITGGTVVVDLSEAHGPEFAGMPGWYELADPREIEVDWTDPPACSSCGSYPAAPGSKLCTGCAATGLAQHEAFAG